MSELDLIRSRDLSGGPRCWDIARDERYGRHMVAVRDIAPGEVICTEQPLMCAPYPTNQVLVCVGCYR